MSLRAELLRLGIRAFLKRRSHHLDIEAWRRDMRAMERLVPRPPARTETVEVKAGRLTLHRVTRPASQPERNVLYLHGGGYVSGAPAYYRHFFWRIADCLGARVWAPGYRLAPVLIQVGSDEILRDDAVRMAEKLRADNPRSRLEIWSRMPHAWQLFVPVLPEARRAIAQIGDFISTVQR